VFLDGSHIRGFSWPIAVTILDYAEAIHSKIPNFQRAGHDGGILERIWELSESDFMPIPMNSLCGGHQI
jgi:hypothetical protein